MDEIEGVLHLTCHVELDVVGPNVPTVDKWAAATLRKLADRMEQENLGDGFHDAKDNVGKKVGELYLSYEEHFE